MDILVRKPSYDSNKITNWIILENTGLTDI